MDDDVAADRMRLDSARDLLALVREYADRAQAAEAQLLAAFSARAAASAVAVGPIVVDDDDDERLLLRADGVLAGEVLDDDTGVWLAVETAEEVVRYYDPTDIFLDLADALVERYPDLAADEVGAMDPQRLPTGGDGAMAASDSARDESAAAPPESATLTMLKDLHRSGVLSDADFEHLREQMRR